MCRRVLIVLCMAVAQLSGIVLLAQAGDASLEPQQIIESYLKAIGGRHALAAIHDRTVKGTIEVAGLSGTIETQQKTPNKMHQVVDLSVAQSEQWFDGEKGYRVDPMQGESPFSDEDVEEAKQNFIMSPFLDYEQRGIKARFVGKEKLDDKEVLVVEMKDPKGKTSTYSFDAATYYLVKIVSPMPAREGTGDQEILLSDYREVGGIKYAFKITRSTPAISVDIVVDSIEVNTGLEDSVFRHQESESVAPAKADQ
jgi:zinc protease